MCRSKVGEHCRKLSFRQTAKLSIRPSIHRAQLLNNGCGSRPSTWRVLGLSVASGYTGLGLFAFCLPHRAAFQYFVIQPRDDDFEEDDNKVTSVTAAVSLLVPLIGARDLSIAAALWTLGYTAKWREFGTVVVAGSILCAADAIAIWKHRGPRLYVEKSHLRRCRSGLMDFHSGSAVALGALSWVGIGLVLQRQ